MDDGIRSGRGRDITTDKVESPKAEAPTGIYLDYQATTPTDPRVLDAMLPWFTARFGNPHSAEHAYGWDAAEAVERARTRIAALIGAQAREIVFTSGATEANNLALKGAAHQRRTAEGRDHIVTLVSEHKCVLESTLRLEQEGFAVTRLPVAADGLVEPERIAAALGPRTALVSVMAAHNEIGVIQPLAEIGRMARQQGVWLHSDAAQAFGKIPLDVEAMCIDLLSISGHKIYGPKGVGALYVRRRKPKVRLQPLMHGGDQERGLRAGTLPTPLCVGLGAAAAIAGREMAAESARLRTLRDAMLAQLRTRIPDLSVNGDLAARLPGNLNITIPGLDGQDLLAALDGLAISSGSACASGAPGASHVLQALGLDPARVAATIRLAPGRFTIAEEAMLAASMIAEAAQRLRGTGGHGGMTGGQNGPQD